MRRVVRSERVKLPRVHRVRRRGAVYKYHKITRARLPSDVPEDHPSFIAAWTAEEGKKPTIGPRPEPGTISEGIATFLRSDTYLRFSAEYRATVRRHAEAIRENYGIGQASDLEARHIDLDLAKLSGHAAVSRRKTWRLLGAHFKRTGLSVTDPSSAADKVRAPKSSGHVPWTLAEVEAYRTRWPIGTTQRLAFELLYWTGARTVDAVALSPSMIGHDGVMTFTQSKTGAPAYVPWSCALPVWGTIMEHDRRILHECLPRGVFTFLETAGGRVRTKKGLSNLISAAAREAGINGRSAHGLRKSRLTILAELGASAHVIMSWGGHKTLSEAQEYTARADRKRILIGGEQEKNLVKHAGQNGKTGAK